MTLRGPRDDGRPPLRAGQQRALIAVAVAVVVGVVVVTLVSGQSLF